MADTQRTLAALITLLANNTTGAISAQDLRDAVVSLTPSAGGMHILPAGSAATTISTQATWTALAGTWTANTAATLRDWTMGSNGALTYNGTETQRVLVSGQASLQPGAGDTEYSIGFAVDGTVDERFVGSVRFAGPQSGNAATTVPFSGLISVAAAAVLTVWVRNDSGTENITANRATLSVMGVIT